MGVIGLAIVRGVGFAPPCHKLAGDESVPSASNGDPRPKTAGIVVQAACRFLAICGPPLVHAGAHSQVQTPAHIHLQQIWDPFRRIGGDFKTTCLLDRRGRRSRRDWGP